MKLLITTFIMLCITLHGHARNYSQFEVDAIVDPFGEIVKCESVELEDVKRNAENTVGLIVTLRQLDSETTNIAARLYYPSADLAAWLVGDVICETNKIEKLPASVGLIDVAEQILLPFGKILKISCEGKSEDLALEMVGEKEMERRERESLGSLKRPRWPMVYKGLIAFNFGLDYRDYPEHKDIGVAYGFYRSLNTGDFSLLTAQYSSSGKIIELIEHFGNVDFSRLEIVGAGTNVICGANSMLVKSRIKERSDGEISLVLEILSGKFQKILCVSISRQGWNSISNLN